MPLLVLGELLFKIVFMAALGYVLRKRGVIYAELQKGLSTLLLTVILPFSILTSSDSVFSTNMAEKLLLSGVIASGYYIAALALTVWLFGILKTGQHKRGIAVTMAVFANVGFIGFPVVEELYGKEGTLYAVIYNLAYQIFLFTIGTGLLSGRKKIDWKEMLLDPVTAASLAALLIFLSPFRFPAIVSESFDAVGSMTVPLSMIIIGCDMAMVKSRTLFSDALSYLVSGLRLLVFPAALAVILKLAGTDPSLARVMVLMTALPCGSLNVILAERYGCEKQFATATVVLSMVLMVITVPVVLLGVAWLWP